MRRLSWLTLTLALLPCAAHAQVLTVDVEATGEEPVRAQLDAQLLDAQLRVEIEAARPIEERPHVVEGAPPIVVVVPPLEDVTVASAPPPPSVAAPPLSVLAAAPPAPVAAAPPAAAEEEDGLQAALHLAVLVESMDLSGMAMEFHNPEIALLNGAPLSPDFAGQDALRNHTVAGGSIGFGMRASRILRGPELRAQFGGGSSSDNPFYSLPGAPDGISASVQSSYFFRIETALGVQIELGPFVPYAMARAAVGGMWVDVAIRDATLGDLGTETLDGSLLQLGLEAGAEVRIPGGPRLGLAFRGSFLGTPSLGGALTLTMVGPED